MKECKQRCPNANECMIIATLQNQSTDVMTGKPPSIDIWRGLVSRSESLMIRQCCLNQEGVRRAIVEFAPNPNE